MTETCVTATLIRGKKYSYNQILKRDEMGNPTDSKFWMFERNIPARIPLELADELEDLVEIVRSAEDDEIEKNRFRVDRNAPVRKSTDRDPTKKVRMRLVAADDNKPRGIVKPKPGVKKTSLYGRSIGR